MIAMRVRTMMPSMFDTECTIQYFMSGRLMSSSVDVGVRLHGFEVSSVMVVNKPSKPLLMLTTIILTPCPRRCK